MSLQLQTFHIPTQLERDLVDFYLRQGHFPLANLSLHRAQLSQHIGVYALYYRGNFSLYSEIAALNQSEPEKPIYVGKAVAVGARSGGSGNNNGLAGRLALHYISISEVPNLEVDDFEVRVIAIDGAGATQWAEQTLIRRLQPAWNVVIQGFGIKVPGANRPQTISVWDTLHPGRKLASALTITRSLDNAALATAIHNTLPMDLS